MDDSVQRLGKFNQLLMNLVTFPWICKQIPSYIAEPSVENGEREQSSFSRSRLCILL